MGESYGRFKIGNDEAVMPHINSCNIACGFHGGDALTIQKTIQLALANGVSIGAHPSFPDLQGFGRRKMDIPAKELAAILQYQIAALKGMTEATGGILNHVKAHGALYNLAAKSEETATTLVESIIAIDDKLQLFGPPFSVLSAVAKKAGLVFISEAFADRNYNDDLSLVSRSQKNALIEDKKAIFEHVSHILSGKVKTITGKYIDIKANTICIHGDQENAAEVAEMLNA